MRKHLRDAIAEIRRQGAEVVEVVEAGRHTEVVFEIDGRRKIVRLHRGNKVSYRTVRGVRSSIRMACRP